MARPHIEFIQAYERAPAVVGDGDLFAGARRRMLSSDDEIAASTALVTLDGGWSTDVGAAEGPLELFLLSGECELVGDRLRAGGYAYVPAGATGRLRAVVETSGLAMLEPPSDGGGVDGPIEVRDTTVMRWCASAFDTVPAGLVNKRLRDDPKTGERTWVAACPPGWTEERAEVHPTVEESMTLRGEILLGSCGVMTPGCYFWRPPMVPHGPMYSRTGAEFFFRTKGGSLEVEYESVPDWERVVAAHRALESLYPVFDPFAGRSAT